MKVDGRCHCGEIRYEAVVDPERAVICHCTDCQMLSGTVYRVGVPAPRESFKLLSGRPTIYTKTADSGNQRNHAFCPRCGTPVYSAALQDPPAYTLRVGCLTQRAAFRPSRQQWCASALPWAGSLEGVPRIEPR